MVDSKKFHTKEGLADRENLEVIYYQKLLGEQQIHFWVNMSS